MIIAISLMGILLTISTTALYRMFRQEALMVERAFETSTWMRLSRDFRRDVHVSRSATPSEDGTRFVLTGSDSRIVWIIKDGDVKRVSQDLKSESDPSLTPGEQYAFSDSTIRFLLEKPGGAKAIASIEVTPALKPHGGASPAKVILAAVGLDHRFFNHDAVSGDQP